MRSLDLAIQDVEIERQSDFRRFVPRLRCDRMDGKRLSNDAFAIL